jgi:hypothetical protein
MFKKILVVKKHISNTFNCNKTREKEIEDLNWRCTAESQTNVNQGKFFAFQLMNDLQLTYLSSYQQMMGRRSTTI